MSSSTIKALADKVGDALKAAIDSERERLTAERDFLKNIVVGRDTELAEAAASDLTSEYLSGILSKYLPVEE